jgi:hypothetical protein
MKTRRTGAQLLIRTVGHWRLSLLLAIGLLACLSSAGATDQVCFNHVTDPGAPPNFGAPPLIDGSINNGDPRWSGADLGWSNSFRYVFGNPDGPVVPDTIVEGLRGDTQLYISVQANNTTPKSGSSDPLNAVVVAFDPDGTGTKMQWFVIYPVLNGATNGNKQDTQSVEFYYNQSNLSNPLTDASHYVMNPSWLPGSGTGSSNAPCSTAGATCIQVDDEGGSWSMEMAVPIVGPMGDPSTGLILPSTGHFGFYINVLRIVAGEQWAQSAWPAGHTIPGCPSNATCYLNDSLPPTTNWGNGFIDPHPSPACNGLSLGSQNLSINVTNSTFPVVGSNWIDAMSANTFHANVSNTGSAANNVTATFFIANFGLPSSQSWQQVAISQPSTGSTIPAGGGPLTSNTWQPSDPSVFVGHEHQCILARLDANPPNNTVFTNNSAVQNATVFNASTVEFPVTVSSKGYTVNPEHNTDQLFDIVLRTKQDVINPCQYNQTATVQRDCTPVSQLVETAEACRHTGTYLSDKNKTKRELCEPLGSFTFVAKHKGAVDKWNYQLTGPGLGKPDSNGVYHLRLANNTVVDLKSVIGTGGGGGTTGGCGSHGGSGGAMFVFGGLLLAGIGLYRPRRNKE